MIFWRGTAGKITKKVTFIYVFFIALVLVCVTLECSARVLHMNDAVMLCILR